MESAEVGWLDAVHEGLVGTGLTQPLHPPEVRAALSEDLELLAFFQALMRFGYLSGAAPSSPRRSIDELLGTGLRVAKPSLTGDLRPEEASATPPT